MVPSNGVTLNVVFRRCSGGDAAAINCRHSANTRAMICSMAPVGSIGSLEREEEDAFNSSGSIVIVAGVTDDALTGPSRTRVFSGEDMPSMGEGVAGFEESIVIS